MKMEEKKENMCRVETGFDVELPEEFIEHREYTKESLITDLEYKIEEIQKLQKGLNWIIEHYKKGELPD